MSASIKVMIRRDPFARTELHREIVSCCTGGSCSWCGQVRKGKKLFVYSTHHDGGRVEHHRGLFCSKSCHDSYHS